MDLIKLTVYQRGTILSGSVGQAFDVNGIVSPIRLNTNSKSYFVYSAKKPAVGAPFAVLPIDYQVTQSLAAIQALNSKLVILTVTKRRGVGLFIAGVKVASESMVFNVDRVSETFFTTVDGTRFFYCEDGDPEPVQYDVSESIDTILAQIPGGSGTVTSFSSGNASPLFTTTVATANTTPSQTFTRPTQNDNLFYAGPVSGSATAPTFRAIDPLDIVAALGTQTNEAFDAQTNTTTLANTPLSARHLLVFVDAGSGLSLMQQGVNYTLIANVITWIPPLAGYSVVVFYSY